MNSKTWTPGITFNSGDVNYRDRERDTLNTRNNLRVQEHHTSECQTSEAGQEHQTSDARNNHRCLKFQALEADNAKSWRLGTPNLRFWMPTPLTPTPRTPIPWMMTPSTPTLGRRSRPFCNCQSVQLLLIITN